MDSEEALTKLIHFMDRNEANLIGFLWLRRLNYAWATCSNGVTLNAVRPPFFANRRTASCAP